MSKIGYDDKQSSELLSKLRVIYGTTAINECEVRFGRYDKVKDGHKFNSSNDSVTFNRMVDTLSNSNRYRMLPTEISTVEYYKNERKITDIVGDKYYKTIRKITDNAGVSYQEKIKKPEWTFDDRNYGYRISGAVERPVNPPDPFIVEYTRQRTRISFESKEGNHRYDLTRVVNSKSSEPEYEIELEFEKETDPRILIHQLVKEAIIMIQGTKNFIKLSERFGVLRKLNDTIYATINSRGFAVDNRFVNKPINLSAKDILKMTDYVVADKSDGVRKFMFIDFSGIYFFYPLADLQRITDPGVKIPLEIQGYIFDGELVASKSNNNCYYKIFDVLFGVDDKGNSIDVRQMDLMSRLGNIVDGHIDIINGLISFQVALKTFYPLDDYFKTIESVFEEIDELDYENDGLIFTPLNSGYLSDKQGRDYSHPIYKWKPIDKLSIDFQIKSIADNKFQLLTYTNNNGKKSLEPFLGDVSHPFKGYVKLDDDYHDGQVVEFAWDGEFYPLRIRYDRDNGNSTYVANLNWMDIFNPITKETLTGQDLKLNFKYHNMIKRNLIDEIDLNSLVLDIGIGRGGDLDKYKNRQARVVGIDVSRENLEELARRAKFNNYTDKLRIMHRGGEESDYITQAIGEPVDVVAMFFSLSFFFSSREKLDELIDTITRNLKQGGHFIGTTIDGLQVSKLLGTKTKVTRPGYSIARAGLSTSDSISFGQQVEFKIPGSIVGTQMEWLVDFEELTRILKEHEIELIETKYFEPQQNMNQAQIQFTSLFRTFKFVSNKSPVSKKSSESQQKIALEEGSPDQGSPDQGSPDQGSVKSILAPDDTEIYDLPKVGQMVRIGTIAEGSCFFHSISWAVLPSYRKMTGKQREVFIGNLRESLSKRMTEDVFYSLANGNFSEMITWKGEFESIQQKHPDLSDIEIVRKWIKDPSAYVGEEIFKFISDIFDIDIFIIGIDNGQLHGEFCDDIIKCRDSIVIAHLDHSQHFEILGHQEGDKITTFFDFKHPVIKELYKQACHKENCSVDQ